MDSCAVVDEAVELPSLRDSSGLLSWQPESIKRLVRSIRLHNFALDASDPGTGKTTAALAVARELGKPVVVICPKIAKSVWQYWAHEMGVRLIAVESYEKVRFGSTPYGVWQENKPRRSWFYWDKNFLDGNLFILDEVHRCRAAHSQLSDMLIDAAHQKIPMLLLSATMAESPLHLKALGYLLGWHKVADFYSWCSREHCRPSNYGWRYFGSSEHMASLHARIFPEYGNRIKVKDLGSLFPDTTVEAVSVPIEAEGRRSIQSVYAELRAMKQFGPVPLSAQIKFRMAAETAKVKVFAEMAKAELENNLSVVIFFNFTKSLHDVAALLGAEDMIIDGAVSEGRRREVEALFQSNKRFVVCCNQASGAQCISFHDLLKQRRRVVLLSPSCNAIDLKQALGRVPRAGGTSSIQRIVFAENSIEEQICSNLRRKLKFQQAWNDGDLDPAELF